MAAAPPEPTPSPITVIDADTVEQGGVRYRLLDMDAPEIHRARCPAERQAGIRAAARLIDLLASGSGVLSPQINTRGRVTRDKYGRVLARLTIGGVAWSVTAIAEGHAVAWDGRGAVPGWCGSV